MLILVHKYPGVRVYSKPIIARPPSANPSIQRDRLGCLNSTRDLPILWVFRSFEQAPEFWVTDFSIPTEAASKFRINSQGRLLHKCMLPRKLLSETVKPTHRKQFLQTLIILNCKTREWQTNNTFHNALQSSQQQSEADQ